MIIDEESSSSAASSGDDEDDDIVPKTYIVRGFKGASEGLFLFAPKLINGFNLETQLLLNEIRRQCIIFENRVTDRQMSLMVFTQELL